MSNDYMVSVVIEAGGEVLTRYGRGGVDAEQAAHLYADLATLIASIAKRDIAASALERLEQRGDQR